MRGFVLQSILFAPLLGALTQLLFPSSRGRLHCWLAVFFAALPVVLLAFICFFFQSSELAVFESSHVWLRDLKVNYHLRVDGLNLLPLLLIGTAGAVSVIYEWDRRSFGRGLLAAFLFLEFSLLGALMAGNLGVEAVFWTAALLLVQVIVAVWNFSRTEGDSPWLLIGFGAASLILEILALLLVFSAEGSFDFQSLSGADLRGMKELAFLLTTLAFVLRVPVFPFTGWFERKVHVMDSTLNALLGASFVPAGLFLYLRKAYLLFPEQVTRFGDAIAWVGVVSLFLATASMITRREKQDLPIVLAQLLIGLALAALGSANGMSYVGGIFVVFALGLAHLGLVALAGVLDEDPAGRGDRALLAAFLLLCGSLALVPGMGGFVGAFLIFGGAFHQSTGLGIALLALALTFVFALLFRAYRWAFAEGEARPVEPLREASMRIRAVGWGLAMALLGLGFFPGPFLSFVEKGAAQGALKGALEQLVAPAPEGSASGP